MNIIVNMILNIKKIQMSQSYQKIKKNSATLLSYTW